MRLVVWAHNRWGPGCSGAAARGVGLRVWGVGCAPTHEGPRIAGLGATLMCHTMHAQAARLKPPIPAPPPCSHLGDARATDMGRARGEHNLGQLLRQTYGTDQVFNIGFSTYTGEQQETGRASLDTQASSRKRTGRLRAKKSPWVL